MKFRDALPHEADALTRLTFRSKRHWGYPEEWMQIWADELTISPKYIEENKVIVAEDGGGIVGYISIMQNDDGCFLDNLFIDPGFIRKGIGEKLTSTALEWCRQNQIETVYVYSDPFSKGFYEKTGAVYLREEASQAIPGRTLPLLVYNYKNGGINHAKTNTNSML